MAKMIESNDLCPCGSGKKFKECCMKDLKTPMREYSRLVRTVNEWITSNSYLKKELADTIKEYLPGEIVDEIRLAALIEAFIFEHRLKNGMTPLEYFLAHARIPGSDISRYKKLMKNRFGIFEVVEVYRGQGMMLKDIVTDREYFVLEKRGSLSVKTGNITPCRIIRVRRHFAIISPVVSVMGEEAGYVLRRRINNNPSVFRNRRLKSFDVFRALYSWQEEVPDDLESIKKRLKTNLDEIGLRIDFRTLNRRINESDHIEEAFPEIFQFNYASNEDYIETFELLKALWDKYPRKEFDGLSHEEFSKMGQKEKMLIYDLQDEIISKITVDDYPSSDKVQEAVDKLKDEWLKTPQKELAGKTPLEVILEERKELGNPNLKFNISISLRKVRDFDEDRAKKFFLEGVEAFKRGALIEAARLFNEVIEIFPVDYQAWGNLGNCYAYLAQKDKAIECYDRALALEPDYEIARKNRNQIMAQNKKQLAAMGVLGIIEGLMHNGDKESDDLNVWKYVEKELKRQKPSKESPGSLEGEKEGDGAK